MKKVLSLILSLALVFSIVPGVLMAQAVEYDVVSTCAGGDFSTSLSKNSSGNFVGNGITLQMVTNLSGDISEKGTVEQSIASGVNSEKVFNLDVSGAGPVFRFKGFTAIPQGTLFRVKFRMYLADSTEASVTSYKVAFLPQTGTTISSSGGGEVSYEIPVGQWQDVVIVTAGTKGGDVKGIKATFSDLSGSGAYPQKIYLDGYITVETVQEAAEKTPDQLLSEDKEALDLGDTSAVIENITLPLKGKNNSTITWVSDDESIVEKNGTIHRGEEDKTTTLTATLSLDGAIDDVTKSFDVTVLKEEQQEDDVQTTVEWETIFSQNFLTWTRYDQTTPTSVSYPARYGASTQNRMEFKYKGTAQEQGSYPNLVFDVEKVSKDAMIASHPGTKNGVTGTGDYAKITRESNLGELFFKLNAATNVAVDDKVRVTFKVFPTDVCLTGRTAPGGDLNYDEEDTVKSISYTVQNNYATKNNATSSGGYSEEITLIPDQWNTVVLEYTATKAGVGGFQFPLGYANYSSDSYTTPFPATIYFDGDIKIEHGVVTVVEEKTPDQLLLEDKDALDLGDLSAVIENITLPTVGENGSAITWVSDDESVVENDGTIHRGMDNKTTTLTATLTLDGAQPVTKTFTVTVAGEESDLDKVNLDKAALDLGDLSAVTKDITLPKKGSVRDSAITWETDDETIVTEEGIITRAEDSKSTVLTATIKNGEATAIKKFTVTVKGTIEKRTLEGVDATPFHGGEFTEVNRIYFGSLFEGDGSNGTNGTLTFTPEEGATEDKNKYIGLVAEKTDADGIRFKGWVADSYTGVNKNLLNKTYSLPALAKLGQPYYVELEVDSQTRGVVTYAFGNNDSSVLEIQKTDSRVKVDNAWKDVLEQEDYVFYINGTEKARTDVVRQAVTTFGIYVIPELKQILIYQNGSLLAKEVFDYANADAILKTLTVKWKQTQGSSGIPSSSYLHLRSMALFEGAALSSDESLALDKEKFRFSLATDEAFDSITKDLDLPSKAVFGSDVKWTSSNADIINPETGKVTRGERNATVTLYAEIGPEGNSVTKSQEFTVLGTIPGVSVKGIADSYFYDNTFYQTERIEFGDLFEDSTVDSEGWAANGTNGTVYVAPITTEGASVGEQTPGLYSKKTDQNGIWIQSRVGSAENNGQGLPIFEKTYTLPKIENPGKPYYLELSMELWIRDSLTLSFGKKDDGVVQIEKLDENEHADRKPEPFVVRTNNIERYEVPYTDKEDMTFGIYVIPELKKYVVYKNGVAAYEGVMDFSKKSSALDTLTIKWEHSTVRTTLYQSNYLHLKHIALYEGTPLPASDCLVLDRDALLLSTLTDETKDQITKDLNIPLKGVYGTDITWESDTPEVINPETGKVVRTDKQETVKLTAHLKAGDKTEDKEFILTVVRKGTDGNLASGSKVAIEKTSTIEPASNLADGIFETYVETLTAGAKPKITIDLGEEKLLSRVIIYERMLDGQYNIKRANLELSADGKNWKKVAALENGIGEKKIVDFTPQSARYICLTVSGVDEDKVVSIYEIEALMQADDSTIAKADASVLKAFDSYNVTESTTLPTVGTLGSVITWQSSNPAFIDNTGKVTRPSGAGALVTLTATVTYKAATETVAFNHYVTGISAGSGGGSGSGGSSSGGGGSKVSGGGVMVKPSLPSVTPENNGIFKDVEKTGWAYPFIEKLYNEKIMEGDGNGSFDPKRPILREEYLKILLLALGVEIEEGGESVFSDVDNAAWYAPFVNTAHKLGISNGMGDGTFGISKTITRQDMAVLANRAASLCGVYLPAETVKTLTDINSVSDYARESVQLLANAGIISGDEYAVFNPQGNALREQAAKIICLIMELKK